MRADRSYLVTAVSTENLDLHRQVIAADDPSTAIRIAFHLMVPLIRAILDNPGAAPLFDLRLLMLENGEVMGIVYKSEEVFLTFSAVEIRNSNILYN